MGRRIVDAKDIVASTQDPAIAIDAGGVILAWNRAAERLLGYQEPQARGRFCWEVVSGRDVFGNDYCDVGCPLLRMAQRHRAIYRCELCFRTGSGKFVHVGVSTLAVPDNSRSEVVIVHLLTPVAPASGCEAPIPWKPGAGGSDYRLTARETEILGLLAEGQGTAAIAKKIFVAVSTVRNHIKRILGKLEVHSRLEAVSLAQRIGLLESLNQGH